MLCARFSRRSMSGIALRLTSSRAASSTATPSAASESSQRRRPFLVPPGPGLEHFIANSSPISAAATEIDHLDDDPPPYVLEDMYSGNGRKVYFDVYGCQMNTGDAEVVWSVLSERGFEMTLNQNEADIWLLVTCSIRESAEDKIWRKLRHIQNKKKAHVFREEIQQNIGPSLMVGLLGCMAERLKEKLLSEDRLVDVVAGPDAYRDLPRLFALTSGGADQSAINVMLSMEETYADIIPSRLNEDKVTGFVSIQRGCDNMCSYCIVPFTRGRERSRPVESILNEVRHLADSGVKEVTLLGQNVNSYRDTREESMRLFDALSCPDATRNTAGFKSIYKPKKGGVRFADLLDKVSQVDKEVRIRFTAPHPKDFPDEVLSLIAERPNICRQLHLPAQCGNSKVLADMRRGYSREAYLELAAHVKSRIPGVVLTTDMIVGFCGETESEFAETLSLMREVRYHKQFIYPYSLRQKTHAHRKHEDDVPADVKKDRMERAIAVYREIALELNTEYLGSRQVVLIEGDSKRSAEWFQGRTDGGVKVNFPKSCAGLTVGDYCVVTVNEANSQGLKGEAVAKTTIAAEEEEESKRESFSRRCY